MDKVHQAARALDHVARAVMALLDVYNARDEERYKSLNRIYRFAERIGSVESIDFKLADEVYDFRNYESGLSCWNVDEDEPLEYAIKSMKSILFELVNLAWIDEV